MLHVFYMRIGRNEKNIVIITLIQRSHEQCLAFFYHHRAHKIFSILHDFKLFFSKLSTNFHDILNHYLYYNRDCAMYI